MTGLSNPPTNYQGVKLKCNNRVEGQLCGNEWDYKGSHPFYATCPRCLRKVKIPKDKSKTK